MQQVTCERIVPKIIYTRASLCDDDLELNENSLLNNKKCSITTTFNNSINLARQKKISRSRVRRNSKRSSSSSTLLTNDQFFCRRSSSSSSNSQNSSSRRKKQFHSDDDDDVDQDYYNNNDDDKNNRYFNNKNNKSTVGGYGQYLLDVPAFNGNHCEWSEPSGDDLSSEWDSDQSLKSDKTNNINDEIQNQRPKVYIIT